MEQMREHDVAGAGRHFPTAPLSGASTVCTSPKDADNGPTWPEDARECQGHESQKPTQLRPGSPVDSAAYVARDFVSSDSSDDGGLDADSDDDLGADHEGAIVVVSEEEMQTRVGDAMRGLERLQGMSIDPGELPTVRALYIRWSIAQWALQGPAHTSRRHATPQRLEVGRDGEGQRQATDAGDMESNGGQIATSRISVAAEAYFGHNLRDARKRVRGDGVSCVVEDTPLGQIRGPGCRFVKAQRCSRYSSF